jgi:hypothetical protein
MRPPVKLYEYFGKTDLGIAKKFKVDFSEHETMLFRVQDPTKK